MSRPNVAWTWPGRDLGGGDHLVKQVQERRALKKKCAKRHRAKQKRVVAEQTRHMKSSQGQILAWAFRSNVLKTLWVVASLLESGQKDERGGAGEGVMLALLTKHARPCKATRLCKVTRVFIKSLGGDHRVEEVHCILQRCREEGAETI